MAKPQKRSSVVQLTQRQGEGILLDGVVTTGVGVQGHTASRVEVSLLNAPVPDRHYVADVAGALVRHAMVKVFFGQEKMAGPGLRSLFVIHLGAAAVKQILSAFKDPPTASIQTIQRQSGR